MADLTTSDQIVKFRVFDSLILSRELYFGVILLALIQEPFVSTENGGDVFHDRACQLASM